MVYGEDEVVTLLLVPLPILFQITTKMNISDSKQRSAVFHVKVIVESVVVVTVTSGGPGWAGGEERRKYINNNNVVTACIYIDMSRRCRGDSSSTQLHTQWFHLVFYTFHYYSIVQDFTTSNSLVLLITQSTDVSYHQLITSHGVYIGISEVTIPVYPHEK